LSEFFLAFGLVFVAELGDKSQFLVLWYATRYRWWLVVAGMAAAVLVLQLLAVVVGQAIGHLIPDDAILIAGGLLFLAFAYWSFRGARNGNDEEGRIAKDGSLAVFLIVASTFFLSEFGDKTQLLTLSLSARSDLPLAIWFGSSSAMIVADSLAIGLGLVLGRRIPRVLMAYVAAVLFAAFGLVSIASVFV